MLIITTIYYAEAETARKLNRDRIDQTEDSHLRNADRKVVVVYQGTSRA